MSDRTPGCPHCPGHRDPNRRPWSVAVSILRDRDGQPVSLGVAPSAGGHVAESDAAWLREVIRRGRLELDIPPTGDGHGLDTASPDGTEQEIN